MNKVTLLRALVSCYAVTFAALAGFCALGYFLRSHGEPPPFIAWEGALLGRSTLLASWISRTCYPYFLVPLCIVLLIVAWRAPAWRSRAILSVVSLLVSWRAADLFQWIFARPRPPVWFVRHELTFSYPSSHAAIAAGFYALWAVMIYVSDLPRTQRTLAALLLMLLAAAICWSRLALGAHYLTDLIGGVLLGIAVASIALGIYVSGLFGAVAGRRQVSAE